MYIYMPPIYEKEPKTDEIEQIISKLKDTF